nr:MAG TPA: hypothetical protein [Bacteriophage sp.]
MRLLPCCFRHRLPPTQPTATDYRHLPCSLVRNK